MKDCLRIPLNFDRRAEVTLFTRRLNRVDLAFLVWLEWGNQQQEWRKVTAADPAKIDWKQEDISYLLTNFAHWTGDVDLFMDAAVDSGLLEFEQRAEVWGLVLTGFAKHNPDLLPFHQSPGQKGGAAKSVHRSKTQAKALARKQIRIEAQTQGDLILPDGMTRQDREAAIELIIRIDRACAQSSRQSFADDLIADAVAANHATSEQGITDTLTWLIGQRDNPAVVTQTDRVLRAWPDLVSRACPPEVSE